MRTPPFVRPAGALWRRAALTLLAALALGAGGALGAGCETIQATVKEIVEPKPEGTRWEDVPESQEPVQRKAATSSDFVAEAAGCLTQQECQQRANLYAQTNLEHGWGLFQGCMKRADFVELEALRKPPWNGLLKQRVDLYPRVMEVVVIQGADALDAEMKALGLPIAKWTPDITPTVATPLFTLRGEITKIQYTPKGRFAIIEETELEGGGQGRWQYNYGARRWFQAGTTRAVRSGRKVVMKLEGGSPVKPKHEYLFIARDAEKGVGRALYEAEAADDVVEFVSAALVR